jgi:hypothetical protein
VSLYNTVATEASPTSCPHCASSQLFVRDEPPHITLRCGSRRRWIRRVRRSEAAKYPSSEGVCPDSGHTGSLVSRALPAPLPPFGVAPKPVTVPFLSQQAGLSFAPRDDSHRACLERFERIERELTIVVRAFLACGVLQGSVLAEIEVDGERVYGLAAGLAEGEER